MLAVDRHRRRPPEVGAARDVLRLHRAKGLRLFDGRIAVRIGDAEFADDDLGIDPFSLMSPRTSITLPTGPRVGVGHVVICTRTISPGSASADCPVGM